LPERQNRKSARPTAPHGKNSLLARNTRSHARPTLKSSDAYTPARALIPTPPRMISRPSRLAARVSKQIYFVTRPLAPRTDSPSSPGRSRVAPDLLSPLSSNLAASPPTPRRPRPPPNLPLRPELNSLIPTAFRPVELTSVDLTRPANIGDNYLRVHHGSRGAVDTGSPASGADRKHA
jgi:hypothetical protein